MNAPTLYLGFARGGDAVVCRVIAWPELAHQTNPHRLPTVAVEVPHCPGVFDRVHEVSRETLAEAVVSEDPEAARSAVNEQLIAEYVTANDDPEDQPLPWEDDDQEQAS